MAEQNKNYASLIFLIIMAVVSGPVGWIILFIWILTRLKSGNFDQQGLKNMLQYNKVNKKIMDNPQIQQEVWQKIQQNNINQTNEQPDLESLTTAPIQIKPVLNNQGEVIRGIISATAFIALLGLLIYFLLK